MILDGFTEVFPQNRRIQLEHLYVCIYKKTFLRFFSIKPHKNNAGYYSLESSNNALSFQYGCNESTELSKILDAIAYLNAFSDKSIRYWDRRYLSQSAFLNALKGK